jgi:hypothetical protein
MKGEGDNGNFQEYIHKIEITRTNSHYLFPNGTVIVEIHVTPQPPTAYDTIPTTAHIFSHLLLSLSLLTIVVAWGTTTVISNQ